MLTKSVKSFLFIESTWLFTETDFKGTHDAYFLSRSFVRVSYWGYEKFTFSFDSFHPFSLVCGVTRRLVFGNGKDCHPKGSKMDSYVNRTFALVSQSTIEWSPHPITFAC